MSPARHRHGEPAARDDAGRRRPASSARAWPPGINNTFRQVGIATGIAALGAIFQSQVGGNTFGAGHLDSAGRAAFITGLNAILEVGAVVAGVGAVLAFLLVRGKDFVASGPPPTADA